MHLLVLRECQYAFFLSSAMVVNTIGYSSVGKKLSAPPVLQFYRKHAGPGCDPHVKLNLVFHK